MVYIQIWEATLCRYRLQPEVVLLKEVEGEEADALAGELPGLVMVQGSGGDRKAVVTDARQHEKLLEKVGARAAVPMCVAELKKAYAQLSDTFL